MRFANTFSAFVFVSSLVLGGFASADDVTDINLDRIVDMKDVQLLYAGNLLPDCNGNGRVDPADLFCLDLVPFEPVTKRGGIESTGDIDGDGRVGVTDLKRLGTFLFGGGAAPIEVGCSPYGMPLGVITTGGGSMFPTSEAVILDQSGNVLPALVGDVNADGRRDISDLTYLSKYLFHGGPSPAEIRCTREVVSFWMIMHPEATPTASQ